VRKGLNDLPAAVILLTDSVWIKPSSIRYPKKPVAPVNKIFVLPIVPVFIHFLKKEN
jgi:hypothetical protein